MDTDLSGKKEGQAREGFQEAAGGKPGDLRGKGLGCANSASSTSTPSPGKPITVDGEPGWSLPGAMPSGSGPTVKVLCVSPDRQSRSIERRRIAMCKAWPQPPHASQTTTRLQPDPMNLRVPDLSLIAAP